MAVIKFRRPDAARPGSGADAAGRERQEPQGGAFFSQETDKQTAETPSRRQGVSDYARKIRSHRVSVFLRVMLTVAAVAAIAALVIVQLENRIFTEATFTKAADIHAVEGTVYRNFSGTILFYSKDGAGCTDTKGNARWNITYEMQRPLVAVCGDVVAIGDYGGSTVYVMDTDGQMGTVDTDLPIRALSVAKNGTVAAVLGDTNAAWVNMFRADGTLIEQAKMTMKQMGYPLSISVSPNGELLCVSHLQVDGTSVKTSVAFYNFGAVGQNYSDNCVSGFDYAGEVVPYVRFLDDATSIAVSDSRLAFFNGKQIPQNGTNNLFSENLEGVYHSENYAALLFADATGAHEHRLDLYNTAGSKVNSIGFDLDYTDIQLAGDRIIISNGQECQIYSTAGVQKYAGEFGRSVSAVIPSQRSNVLTVVTDEAIETMTLR